MHQNTNKRSDQQIQQLKEEECFKINEWQQFIEQQSIFTMQLDKPNNNNKQNLTNIQKIGRIHKYSYPKRPTSEDSN